MNDLGIKTEPELGSLHLYKITRPRGSEASTTHTTLPPSHILFKRYLKRFFLIVASICNTAIKPYMFRDLGTKDIHNFNNSNKISQRR